LKPDPRAATANAKARVLIDSGKLVEAGQLLSAFTQENPEVLDHITVGLIAEIKYLMQAKVKSNPQWREQTEKEFVRYRCYILFFLFFSFFFGTLMLLFLL
jgi:hypothetical protein